MRAKRFNASFLTVLSIIVFQGCAVKIKPQYSDYVEECLFNIESESILLMNVRTKNKINPKHNLQAMILELKKDGEKMIYKCILSENLYRMIDQQGFSNNLILAALPPGEYELDLVKGVTWYDRSKVVSHGRGIFQFPVRCKIAVQPGKLSYLGRIEAVMRERKKNEYSAGPSTPLLEQSISGVLSGTFDVSSLDAFDMDRNYFFQIYPQLQDQPIEKQVIDQLEKPDKSQYDSPKTHFFFWNK